MTLQTGHILVVDDDEMARLSLSRQLQKQGYTVTTVADGEAALAQVRQQPTDLVLLDLLMPRMDGFQVLQALGLEGFLERLSVVVVSGVADLDSLTRCVALGAEDFLFKPCHPVLLQARVSACLDRRELRAREQQYLDELEAEKLTAETANQAKTAFLTHMSHELRTPLNVILGYSDILREDLEALDASLLTDVDKIRDTGKELLRLINTILDISKLEAGEMGLTLETFHLRAVLDGVANQLTAAIAAQDNTLTVACDPALDTMHADLSKVRQVLWQLLHNAAKFTRQGTISLRAQPTTIPLPDGSTVPAVRFEVQDTGIGIRPEQQQDLFQLFHQPDDPFQASGGTGLGLALSQRFCDLMGGHITVDSTPAQGTTFTVCLPLDVVDHQVGQLQPPPAATAPSDVPTAPPDARLVLVIDGNPAVRDQMVTLLNQQNYRVVTTWGTGEGLRLTRELQPDLVILGLLTPSVEAWDFVFTLKRDAGLAPTPVLMTAIAPTTQTGFTLGVTEHLTNPTDFKRLVILLRQICQHTTSASPCPGQILLVQKDPTARQMLHRLLEKEGWQTTVTDRPALALPLATQLNPNVLVLDLVLSDMEGLNLLMDLRQHPRFHTLPTVLVTTRDITREGQLWLQGYLQDLLARPDYPRDRAVVELTTLTQVVCPTDAMASVSPEEIAADHA